jgi:VWFA-related protein
MPACTPRAAPLGAFSGLQLTIREGPWQHPSWSEGIMRSNRWIRVILLGLLIGVLGVPPGALKARARQQEGPQKPPAAQTPLPAPPTPAQQQQQTQQQGKPEAPRATISSVSTVVHVDAVVTDQNGDILNGLKKENFRILDNGQPQQIQNFAPTDAPITIVILMEFSRLMYGITSNLGRYWAAGFLDHLTNKDWVAFKTFDLKTTLQVDFTHDRDEIRQSIGSLFFPDFREANIFDATLETLDQLRDVQGKKSILLIATGYDTFSKHTLDQTLKRLKETDVTIFCVGMAEALAVRSPNGGGVSYLQAQNQLNTFASMTGGYAWSPRFMGEMNDIFNTVAAFLHSQYTIGFSPTTAPDGKYHKLKIEVLDEKGDEFMVADKKGKMKKVIVYARQGYTAPATPAVAGN